MFRWFTWGTLVGLAIGLLLYFIYPQLLDIDFWFKINSMNALGYPANYYSPKGGIYEVGVTGMIIGIFCGFIGMLVYGIKSKLSLKSKSAL